MERHITSSVSEGLLSSSWFCFYPDSFGYSSLSIPLDLSRQLPLSIPEHPKIIPSLNNNNNRTSKTSQQAAPFHSINAFNARCSNLPQFQHGAPPGDPLKLDKNSSTARVVGVRAHNWKTSHDFRR